MGLTNIEQLGSNQLGDDRLNPTRDLHLADANTPTTAESAIPSEAPLASCVEQAMRTYFQQLDGQPATEIYQMVLNEIEAPLLKAVMEYTRDNQTKASEVLGLNRGTLRKKLKQHGLL